MITISDEYCHRCGDNRPVYEYEFVGCVHWRCLECGAIIYTEYFDDGQETFDGE